MRNFISNFKEDFFGGLTAGIVAFPLALAFGVSSGLGPSAGLNGAIFIRFFATLFVGTNTQFTCLIKIYDGAHRYNPKFSSLRINLANA